MNNKPEIIYIMSDNRSGSTLLENILSKSEECFSVGELAMLRGHLLKNGPGEKWNWTCSCGKPFDECIFWSSIVKQTFEKSPENFFTSINWNFKSKALALNAGLPFLFKKRFLKIINSNNNKKVISTLNELYKLVHEHSGILDVFYYRRLCYTVSTMVKPSDILMLDYEALAQNTHEELQKIFEAFAIKPFATPEYMELIEDHTIGGTPGRFAKKPIQYDEGWKDQFYNDKFAYLIGGVLNKI